MVLWRPLSVRFCRLEASLAGLADVWALGLIGADPADEGKAIRATNSGVGVPVITSKVHEAVSFQTPII